jgi:hypothetical protein
VKQTIYTVLMIFYGSVCVADARPPGILELTETAPKGVKLPKASDSEFCPSLITTITGDIIKCTQTSIMCKYEDSYGDTFIESFPCIDLLIEGKFPSYTEPSHGYTFRDLEIDDHVQIEYYYDIEKKVKYVVRLSIQKRPNGQVPPSSIVDNRESAVPYHIKQNVRNRMQALEPVTDAEIIAVGLKASLKGYKQKMEQNRLKAKSLEDEKKKP